MPQSAARRTPKLDDVARAAGVSTATVSRCLNAPESVREQTRDVVLAAVRDLGYVPNLSARALASRRTNAVGAVVPTLENSIFALGLQAFQSELARRDTTLLVASSDYDSAEEVRQIRTLVARGVDGLLLIGTSRPPEIYEFLQARRIPYLLAWNTAGEDHRSVGFDNVQAARAITEAVIASGHTRIAMVAGLTADNDRAACRVVGAREAMTAAGLGDLTVRESAYTFEDAGRAFADLIDTPYPPTAIVCGNDVLAAGVIRAAQKRGLTVPDQLSVTGFDDTDLADVIAPPITTVRVPHRRMGTASAALLMAMIDGEEETQSIVFETSIVHRASLAPPPA